MLGEVCGCGKACGRELLLFLSINFFYVIDVPAKGPKMYKTRPTDVLELKKKDKKLQNDHV
ncbi:hypothetical protein E2C01_055137 [Portunus trituberculatus]|uniref:Uncharacterized protein n=1 Tax=Portunus trituberculatus TaxID=210409 RepID=A0A5B7GWT9_PORTR|nr:hypothetical protein [Portunus trituberculatus]